MNNTNPRRRSAAYEQWRRVILRDYTWPSQIIEIEHGVPRSVFRDCKFEGTAA